MTFDEFLKSICKNCKEANGNCIKDYDAYIGLCSENDREELKEYFDSKRS